MLDENNQSFNNNSSRLLLDGGDLSFKADEKQTKCFQNNYIMNSRKDANQSEQDLIATLRSFSNNNNTQRNQTTEKKRTSFMCGDGNAGEDNTLALIFDEDRSITNINDNNNNNLEDGRSLSENIINN